MSIQYSTSVRNNQLDQVEATAGASAKLQLWSGAAPATCAAAATGTKLAELALPADWMAAAAAGAKALSGSWSGTAIATGTAGYFRVVDNAGTTCHVQGTCGIGSGDLQLDNTSIAVGQTVNVSAFTLTAGNA